EAVCDRLFPGGTTRTGRAVNVVHYVVMHFAPDVKDLLCCEGRSRRKVDGGAIAGNGRRLFELLSHGTPAARPAARSTTAAPKRRAPAVRPRQVAHGQVCGHSTLLRSPPRMFRDQ